MEKTDVRNTLKDNNAALTGIFHRMAQCYRYLGEENRFRVIAYEGAARTISSLRNDISHYGIDVKSLDRLKGIGESIAEKIIEYLQTGHIRTYDSLKKKVPESLLELMDISGCGPATVRQLHEKLHINSMEDLQTAVNAGKLSGLKGMGGKKIENLRRGLKLFKESGSRLLLQDAMRIGQSLLDALKDIPGIEQVALAGSLRRGRETVGDIDIVASAARRNWNKIMNRFVRFEMVASVLARGETRTSVLLSNLNTQVDLRLVEKDAFGAALLYFTGSREHNIRLRMLARDRGWKLNEYGIFDATTEKRLAAEKEEDIYQLLGLDFIAPELREDRGELDLAAKGKLPKLLTEKEMRGDMHVHSEWSDGADSIEALAKHVIANFPHYDYIVITDHSPSERIAHGLKESDFLKQFKEIDAVNRKLGKNFIKKGVELDILADGNLDLPDELLAQFDWVTASIHSGFGHDNTARLLKACEHPLVHCLGHPSGRLIGQREAYPINWDLLFEKALAFKTVIEINAQPLRLDLSDMLVKAAVEKGLYLSIGTDAHALGQLEFMKLGIAVARRGYCSAQNIINTHPWKWVVSYKKTG
jgi:DNA polymerase (family 10)